MPAARATSARVFSAPKVSEVFVLFWVVKVLTTGIGEAGADYLAKVNLLLAAGVGLFGFWFAMRAQLRAQTYHPVRYWVAVLMVAIFGTMCADGPHLVLGTPYWFDSVACAATLAALFGWWQRSEGTLSVHSITTARRERFYWVAVLLTFGLGTALGDTTAFNLHLGYSWSTLLFGVAILVPLALWRTGVFNAVAAFWSAYVLTRPLGASIADWLGKPADKGGLGMGDGVVFAAGLVAFALLVGYLTRTHGDVEGAHAAREQELLPGAEPDPAFD